jgi:hypothetical protein
VSSHSEDISSCEQLLSKVLFQELKSIQEASYAVIKVSFVSHFLGEYVIHFGDEVHSLLGVTHCVVDDCSNTVDTHIPIREGNEFRISEVQS